MEKYNPPLMITGAPALIFGPKLWAIQMERDAAL